MKWFGGVVLVLYALVMMTGWAPFSGEEKDKVPGNVRRGPSGVLLWTGGFQGGK
ncbi:hypothetical protein LY474_15860 [Myxococcus stipitatus]|uniref:hypothetical protein n=1 Tax=Myxococcus stipitatus TaxID=83455 RepID=UPI001F333782|nr:hypothetical protein [Myxococcus stipitatus]MCE9669287.1 hypothetical protein [Myxococcus stipitatus]